MQNVEELKKQIRAPDLALAAAKKRQSPRTGFVHYFPADESAVDTIPLYENFCFALALFRHKTSESVLEGKEMIERLLHFQTASGSFPIYLHDYPRCWDPLMPLKVASVLFLLLRHFGPVLGETLKEKIENAQQKLKDAAEKRRLEKPLPPLWENRFCALFGQVLTPLATERFSASEWSEWLLTAQIAKEAGPFAIPYDSGLEAFVGIPPEQEKGEPRPCLIEWVLADSITSPRLLRDHPDQILAAPLFPAQSAALDSANLSIYSGEEGAFRLLWKGKSLHSLAAKASRIERTENRIDLFFQMDEEMKTQREDLFEAALFIDVSAETELFIEGRKGTLFRLGDRLTVRTPAFAFDMQFDLLEGSGDFCGHLFRGNRPSQTACKGPLLYEAYDWQVGIRTLRRSSTGLIRASIFL